MIDKVIICGIPHNVLYKEDIFDSNAVHFGQIDHRKCEIIINKDLPKKAIEETLMHEIIHGILVHIGRREESNDENFVQALANAMNQTFMLRKVRK